MALRLNWRIWLALAALLAGWWAGGLIASVTAPRGAVLGPPPAVAHSDRSLGINVNSATFAAADAERVKAIGVRWLRVNGAPPSEWLDRVRAQGLRVLVVLPASPEALPAVRGDSDLYFHDWREAGRRARDIAISLRGRVDAYQIGDEPNLAARWGGGFPNPADYAVLLREAAINIRDADPDALIVSAALAPTTESGPLNLNEPAFLRQMYRAGARDFFDVLGAEPFGFWSGPDDRRVSGDTLNFSRLILLRDVMAANNDSGKAIWATSFGWYVKGETDSPYGGDSAERQSTRTLDAIERARDEWPWLGPLMLARWQPESASDVRRGFALVDSSGAPTALLTALSQPAGSPHATVGRHAPDDPAATYPQSWRVTASGADVAQGDATPARIAFRGTRFDLTVRRGMYEGDLFVTVDGRPANALPRDGQGRAYLVLYDPLGATVDVTVASGLPDGEHQVEIVPQGGWGQWSIAGWAVARERDDNLVRWGAALAGALLVLIATSAPTASLARRAAAPAAVMALRIAPLLRPAARFVVPAVLLLGAALYLSPSVLISFALIVVLFVLICARLDAGLALVALAIPFYLQPKALVGGSYAVVEIALGLCVAAFVAQRVTRINTWSWQALWAAVAAYRPAALDRVVLLWIVAGAVGVLVAENTGVANREFRVVFIEPALYYVLIRWSGTAVAPLADAFLAGAALVAGKAVSDWFTHVDLIAAEGVMRARSVYFSPNNLALYLDRAAPVALALALFGGGGLVRRLVYAASGVLLLVALYLTYARGAWLLAAPAALLLIGLARGRRVMIGAVAALAALALALLPVLGTTRLQSLFDLTGGTTFIRVQLWQAALAMLRDHWLLGVGPDNFLYQYRTHYILPGAFAEAGLSHPHNVLLDFWTRLGVPGLVLLAALLVVFWRAAWRRYRALPDGTPRALVLGWMAAMAASLAHGLIDNSFFLVDLAFVLMLGLATIASHPPGD
ncbi:MAG: O-antigen ligase family protein [Chloroflexi bacterium]|nr:O-antigen ligase family protein [Chloroflexota bacterium]